MREPEGRRASRSTLSRCGPPRRFSPPRRTRARWIESPHWSCACQSISIVQRCHSYITYLHVLALVRATCYIRENDISGPVVRQMSLLAQHSSLNSYVSPDKTLSPMSSATIIAHGHKEGGVSNAPIRSRSGIILFLRRCGGEWATHVCSSLNQFHFAQ